MDVQRLFIAIICGIISGAFAGYGTARDEPVWVALGLIVLITSMLIN